MVVFLAGVRRSAVDAMEKLGGLAARLEWGARGKGGGAGAFREDADVEAVAGLAEWESWASSSGAGARKTGEVGDGADMRVPRVHQSARARGRCRAAALFLLAGPARGLRDARV